jgi:hypothetical protein
MKIRAFWDVAPCSLGEDRRFRGAYYLHHRPDDEVLTSQTSIYSETTRRYIPEGSNLRIDTSSISILSDYRLDYRDSIPGRIRVLFL